MLLKTFIIILVVVAVLVGAFYYFNMKDYFVEKGCFHKATMERLAAKKAEDLMVLNGINLAKRSDYDKIFRNVYQLCLQKYGATK